MPDADDRERYWAREKSRNKLRHRKAESEQWRPPLPRDTETYKNRE